MTIKIDNDVPIPSSGSSTETGLLVTLTTLKVGESFVYPLIKRNSVSGTISLGRRSGAILQTHKYTTRKISDTELRVWRTE